MCAELALVQYSALLVANTAFGMSPVAYVVMPPDGAAMAALVSVPDWLLTQ